LSIAIQEAFVVPRHYAEKSKGLDVLRGGTGGTQVWTRQDGRFEGQNVAVLPAIWF
jgi:hypothetical protein